MSNIHRFFAIVFVSIGWTTFCFGQLSSSSSIKASDVQYSFEAPDGWKRTANQDGHMMTSPAGGVVVVVKPHAENDFAKAVRTTEIDSTYTVVGEPKNLENGGKSFRVTKSLANGGTGVVDVFIMLSPNGGGVIVLALSGPANADSGYKVGLGVANSVSFPGAVNAANNSQRQQGPARPMNGSPWQAALSNKHLLFLYSGNGYFEERHYYLCSSGVFYYKAGSGGYTPGNSDGGSYAGRSGNSGKWGVSGSTLVLQFQNGNVVQFNLTERQARNEVGLNGKRYFVEAWPNCK